MDKAKRTRPTSNETPEWIRISDEREAKKQAERERILQANKRRRQDEQNRLDENNRIANLNSPFGKYRPLVRISVIGVALLCLSAFVVYVDNLDFNYFEIPSSSARAAAATVNVALAAGQGSSEFYLDGTYSTSITITDDSDTCVLSLWARENGESLGTEVFNDVVFGNSGKFPGPYQQTFSWDSVAFYGEAVRFFNEGSCETVTLSLSQQ